MAEERRPSQFEHYLSLGASIAAPITVISTLLFYFGYVSSRAQYAYFGIDVNTIGLSTQDYVMRSPQPLLVPLLGLVVLSVALVALHLALTARLARTDAGRARVAVRRALVAGLLLLVAGLLLVVLYPMLADWPQYNLVTPSVMALGASVTVYTWRLRSRLGAGEPAPAPPASPALRRMGQVLLCVLIAATVFWSTATIAQWAGRGLARRDARHLDQLPAVILDTKERLFLRDPGVTETALVPAADGQTFHYRYRNLRLLIDGHDRMFLVPTTWSASDSTLVVPLDGSVRVRFQFDNDPP